ncbi:MAG: 2Fe-2S iron-sulfur cluster binding domain-containing protein [Sedimentisphaerales bacterium]|nr:2Fe-2S iron-sulfur cluster binding domain-containing protein [Sedimentisphaerales bacterium]
MGLVFLSIFIVSLLAAGLALLLVIAERFIANYGSCEIEINKDKKVTVQGGQPLLGALVNEKIFIPSACGGRGTCGYCKVKVTEGGGVILPTETPFLTKQEQDAGVRLSCQLKIRNDLKIEIPEELLSVKEYQCVCTKIEDLTHDMKRFRFELQDPPQIEYVPGQYVQLLCPPYKGSPEEVYRAYSIASDPAQKNIIDLIIRLVPNGICTTWCFEHLKEGDPVKINGPYGDFGLTDSQAPMVFIAGGSGMAPFVSILHYMEHTGNSRQVKYFYGGNQVRDLCLDEEMKRFEKALTGFEYVPVAADPAEGEQWDGQRGLVTEAVQKAYSDLSGHEGYLCGSPGMIDAAIKVLTSMGMNEGQIYYDKFA